MNNEQTEQPASVDQQGGNGQGQSNGNANGAYDPALAETANGQDNGQEGAVPTTMPGDMPGPLPEAAAGDTGEAAGSADAGGAVGADASDAAGLDVPADLDTGYVGDAGGAYAEASAASDETDGATGIGDASDVDATGAGDTSDVDAMVNTGDTGDTGDTDAAGGDAEATAQAPADGATDSDELVVRTARDPRMESVGANASMEDLLRASEQQYRTLKHNDVIEGTIMRVDRDEILVDIGAKTEGIIPSRELQSLTPEEREALAPGDPILVAVVQPENNEGHALLSLDRARQERSWRDLQRKFEAGEVIQAPVSGHNKGGLLVNIEGVRGFVPSSQISSLPPGEANKQAELSRYHNQVLPLKIIEINRNRNRLILSERQAMQEQRESMRTRLLRELESGQIRPGTVTSIADFGAFVDIGGADGLIHLSELSWKRVSHPSDVLKVGDRINVHVLSVDPNERKIALSLKRTQPEPWSTITENYTLGQVVRGTITQLTSFGAFARLEDGIEGLIHVSELAEGRVAHPRSVVQEGQTVDLKVIRIDPV
ncbi:MAG TPA: 30S ribosomal protein S1, partial [Chloroflexia bacterium]|nr:30S ribosomal protein S1 [Chloroflexia bacterium]